MAQSKSCSSDADRLIDELATIALVQHDLSVQFDALAKAGDPAVGLALLDELDAHFSKKSA